VVGSRLRVTSPCALQTERRRLRSRVECAVHCCHTCSGFFPILRLRRFGLTDHALVSGPVAAVLHHAVPGWSPLARGPGRRAGRRGREASLAAQRRRLEPVLMILVRNRCKMRLYLLPVPVQVACSGLQGPTRQPR